MQGSLPFTVKFRDRRQPGAFGIDLELSPVFWGDVENAAAW